MRENILFTNKRYITRGIANKIPDEIQLKMWIMIEKLRISGTLEMDYLQVFQLRNEKGNQKIIHSQEQPEYRKEILALMHCRPVDSIKIFVIDDGSHSTMILAEEY